MKKKAQLSMPFHWAYVLIAGVVILLFFVGIVMKQEDASKKKLSGTVLSYLEGIFTGASVGEYSTINPISLPMVELSFTCDADGQSKYTVNSIDNDISSYVFFGPKVKTSQLVAWRLNFNMPFKVTDFLMIGSSAISYFIVYDETDENSMNKANELLDMLPLQFGAVAVSRSEFEESIEEVNNYVKIMFFTSNINLPSRIASLPNENVHAVKLSIDGTQAFFYKKNGNSIEPDGNPVNIIPSFDDANPSLIGVIFSDNPDFYGCNMAKAFKRLGILAGFYKERASILASEMDKIGDDNCYWLTALSIGDNGPFDKLKENNIALIYEGSSKLKEINSKLRNFGCEAII